MRRGAGDPASHGEPLYPRRVQERAPRSTGFRPRATFALLYFFGFFFLFSFLLVAPALWRGFRSVSADPAQWDAAQQAVEQAMRPRFWLAVALAAAATLLGGRSGVLPGSR
jgi:hypothetical protein